MAVTSGRFRPETWMAVVLVVGGLAIACAGGFGIADALQGGPPVGLIVGSLFGAGGVLLAVRSLLVRVEFDEHRVRIVGHLRSRTIPRERVIEVDHDVALPVAKWVDGRGRVRWTILSPVMLSETRRRSDAWRRRHKFLQILATWARGDRADARGRGAAEATADALVNALEWFEGRARARVILSIALALVGVTLYGLLWWLLLTSGPPTTYRGSFVFLLPMLFGAAALGVWPRLARAELVVWPVIIVLSFAQLAAAWVVPLSAAPHP
ncbi:hypothetical protein [Homoserinibacter sp. GY 40078]|uniref:hypothetical protein n=1 Tax=Homoserinibacter sp. GY 40078 TaxID=2603275 RepID=UPI0011CA6DAD|nr:hypothetical protein [Homoserinibacter sp. GY 40078]TXK18797.1 hypothetical protein FVQ89_02310 [Homoserinibacter sp. GY 40078]